MRKEHRLRSRNDFAAAYRQGRVHSNQLFVVRVRPNSLSVSRFGFVVGKANGNAVMRNRIKRRLREAARAIDVQPGFDIVIGVRRGIAAATFADLSRSLLSLLLRSDVVGESH
jgi:ribonuclease P protein component